MTTSASQIADVVIVGGAVMGSSTAYHLLADTGFKGRVVVIDTPDGLRRQAYGDELDRMEEPPSYDDVFVRVIEAHHARVAAPEAA